MKKNPYKKILKEKPKEQNLSLALYLYMYVYIHATLFVPALD